MLHARVAALQHEEGGCALVENAKNALQHVRCMYALDLYILYTGICTYMYVHICVYICTYIHVHICVYMLVSLEKRRKLFFLTKRHFALRNVVRSIKLT